MSDAATNRFYNLHGFWAALCFTVLTACSSGGSSNNNNGGGNGGGGGGGGQTTSFDIGGTITGNKGDVILSLNGQQETFSGPTFTFTQRIESGRAWAVAFVSEATGLPCTLTNNVGTAQLNINTVTVTCAPAPSILRFDHFTLGGDLTTGDFNGDGIPDLACNLATLDENPLGLDREYIRYLYGQGNGTFTAAHDTEILVEGLWVGSDRRGPNRLAFDANDDGLDDYILGPSLYLGGANAPSSSALTFSDAAVLANYSPIHLADINNDGLGDIVSMIYGASVLHFFATQINNGDGTFAPLQKFAERQSMGWPNIDRPHNFLLTDVDSDGNIDLIAIVQRSPVQTHLLGLDILYGRGDGTFEPSAGAINLPETIKLEQWWYSIEIAAGDFDGDSDVDLAIASGSNFIQIMRNEGDRTLTAGRQVIAGSIPIHVRAADFDDDGILDLASVNATSRTLHINFGAGDGSFGDASGGAQGRYRSIPFGTGTEVFDMVLADFDMDGTLDIAVAETESWTPERLSKGSIRIFLAPGIE